MKLVSLNGILLLSCNSLLFKHYHITGCIPPLPLMCLSSIYMCLLLLLEYQHRQFKNNNMVDVHQSSKLFTPYLGLYGAGLIITLMATLKIITINVSVVKYIMLAQMNNHDSLIYYTSNLVLGITYLYLFHLEFAKCNNNCTLQWNIALQNYDENCVICLQNVKEGQKFTELQCLHRYHTKCLWKWVKMKQNCPLCQNTIHLTTLQ